MVNQNVVIECQSLPDCPGPAKYKICSLPSNSSSAYVFLWSWNYVFISHACIEDAGIQYGRYPILNCGDNNHEIYKLLNALNSTSLQTAIEDTRASKPSPAFKAFFKDASNADFVRDVLINVTQNVNVPVIANPPILPGPPGFVCVTAEGQVRFQNMGGIQDMTAMRDAYTDCNQQTSAAITLLGARIIIICPRFFDIPALPPPSSSAKSQCLIIDPSHDTRFIGEGESISRFQIWILMNMLVNLYIFRGVGTMLDSLTVNECLGLPASKTITNPQNFVFYMFNGAAQASHGAALR
ncbi:hypothetical protein N7G274_007738 [Stereocaulon virgatum]|uniref:Uncharacterized protein n=1 Tax=Stereocaulon virgatum TaxID=373712 RepID=A0ABR4A3D6_9LECA